MTTEQRDLLRSADRARKAGNMQRYFTLRILAAEWKTMRVGPETTHDAP